MGPMGDSNTVTLQMDWLLKWYTTAYCCAHRSKHLTRFIREASCSQWQSTRTYNRSMWKEWETVACSVWNGRPMPCPSPRGSWSARVLRAGGRTWLQGKSIFQTQHRTVVHTNVTACTRIVCTPTRHNPTTSSRAISFWEREGELPLVTWLQVGDLQGRPLSQDSWARQTELSVGRGWGEIPEVEWVGRLG